MIKIAIVVTFIAYLLKLFYNFNCEGNQSREADGRVHNVELY